MSDASNTSNILTRIRENIKSAVLLREELIDNILICLCCEGHILLEDMPGTGKTTLAKAIANSIDIAFKRIQCVPDILPSDITGINYFNQKENEFVFRRGPIFANIILADEINRASPRSQAALLECMEEKQVTVDNNTYVLDKPFMVIATQNPIETRGTFPLPEAQLDRFMMKLSLGYPSKDTEGEIIGMNLTKIPVKEIKPVASGDDIVNLNKCLAQITLSQPIRDYIVEIIYATRKNNYIRVGASPRAGIALAKASVARAMLYNRAYVLPDDVKALVVPVLSHRIITDYDRSLSQSNVSQAMTNAKILTDIVDGIRAPVTE
ncbi:MAG: AAA family ATPase [Oscillospiraceae bacterium]|nr:AAA family ATPase [Oscillospiraceae bacterium]